LEIKPIASPAEKLISVAAAVQDGCEAKIIRVETCFGKGFSGVQLIGNTGQIVEDGKERAKMALERLAFTLPAKKLMISISPGHVKVEGNHLDLACAVAMAGQLIEQDPVVQPSQWVFAAEIGLGGELRPVPGVVSHGVAAMSGGLEGVVVARENLPELRALEAVSGHTGKRVQYRSFRTVGEVLDWLWGKQSSEPVHGDEPDQDHSKRVQSLPSGPDFSDMELAPDAELVAMTAAAGMHSLLLRGAPGSGKSMFARRLVSLLPDLSPEEHLLALQIHSAHPERLSASIMAGKPPYRSPHHFASAAAILGAGVFPGEVALASGGVLFMDEFPEFRRDVIEALREPIESGEVSVSRAQTKRTWQANALFVAAANNCPCGWRGSKIRLCQCHETRVTAYQNRLSGPIIDRIDMHVSLPERDSARASEMLQGHTKRVEQFNTMKEKVRAARTLSEARNKKFKVRFNRDIPATNITEALGQPAADLDAMIQRTVPKDISSRSFVRLLRIARTVADLDQAHVMQEKHLNAALAWQANQAAKKNGDTRYLVQAYKSHPH
jgi:magnesium chelatase family protein